MRRRLDARRWRRTRLGASTRRLIRRTLVRLPVARVELPLAAAGRAYACRRIRRAIAMRRRSPARNVDRLACIARLTVALDAPTLRTGPHVAALCTAASNHVDDARPVRLAGDTRR